MHIGIEFSGAVADARKAMAAYALSQYGIAAPEALFNHQTMIPSGLVRAWDYERIRDAVFEDDKLRRGIAPVPQAIEYLEAHSRGGHSFSLDFGRDGGPYRGADLWLKERCEAYAEDDGWDKPRIYLCANKPQPPQPLRKNHYLAYLSTDAELLGELTDIPYRFLLSREYNLHAGPGEYRRVWSWEEFHEGLKESIRHA